MLVGLGKYHKIQLWSYISFFYWADFHHRHHTVVCWAVQWRQPQKPTLHRHSRERTSSRIIMTCQQWKFLFTRNFPSRAERMMVFTLFSLSHSVMKHDSHFHDGKLTEKIEVFFSNAANFFSFIQRGKINMFSTFPVALPRSWHFHVESENRFLAPSEEVATFLIVTYHETKEQGKKNRKFSIFPFLFVDLCLSAPPWADFLLLLSSFLFFFES